MDFVINSSSSEFVFLFCTMKFQTLDIQSFLLGIFSFIRTRAGVEHFWTVRSFYFIM